MPDITLCSPTKLMEICEVCYRRKAKPSQWQSYSNFYDACKKDKERYYIKYEEKISDKA